jgi:hypothetical protein
MEPDMLNDEFAAALRSEPGPGERVLWSGRPGQGLVLHTWDIVMIPFSLMWAGFAVFWEAAALASGAPFFFALWGIPFVLIGLYMVAGRFWVDARQRKRTTYALTNERVIILSGLFSVSVTSLNLRTLPVVTLSARSGGRGTITFGPSTPYANIGFGTRGYAPPAFDRIDDAQSVYRRILQAQKDTG